MDLELWPNCLNQPWPGLFCSGIAAGLNFYLLPMALSLSWAILGIDREQLKRRIFGQRIADVFCLSCNLGCIQSQKQDQFPIKFCNKAVHLAILHMGRILVFEQKNMSSKKSVSGTVLGQNPLKLKSHYRKSRYMGTRCIPTVILPKNQWSNIQFG